MNKFHTQHTGSSFFGGVSSRSIDSIETITSAIVYLNTDHRHVHLPNATEVHFPAIKENEHRITVYVSNSNSISIYGNVADSIITAIETITPATTGFVVRAPFSATFESSDDGWHITNQQGLYKEYNETFTLTNLVIGDNILTNWFYSEKKALVRAIVVSWDSDGTVGTYVSPALIEQDTAGSQNRHSYPTTVSTAKVFTGFGATAPTYMLHLDVNEPIQASSVVLPAVYTGWYPTLSTTGWGSGHDGTFTVHMLSYN